MGPGGFEPPSYGPKPRILSKLNYEPKSLIWLLFKTILIAILKEKDYKLSKCFNIMRNLLIILLVLLILGLYFYTDITKNMINLAGDFVRNNWIN